MHRPLTIGTLALLVVSLVATSANAEPSGVSA